MKFNPIKYFGISDILKNETHDSTIFFLTKEEEEIRSNKFNELKKSYKYKNGLSEEHISFLNKIIADEERRQNIIESKLGQIIGQSGLIFTLITLFAPLFYENLGEIQWMLKMPLLLLFIIGFCFFLLSILQATKSFNIRNFIYSRPDTLSVFNISDKEQFIKQTVDDLITGIPINSNSNSAKANLLLYAHRSFSVGFISIAALGLIVTFIFAFHKQQFQTMIIQSPEKVLQIESDLEKYKELIHKIMASNVNRNDSINIANINRDLEVLVDSVTSLKTQFKTEIDNLKKKPNSK